MTDEQLALKAQSGDRVAESELLERYKGIVRSLSRGYYLSAGEYDDLIQEGMIALSGAIYGYTENKGSSFRSFSILCIKRRIYDMIRKDCSKKNEPMKDFVPIDFFVAPLGEEGSQGKEIEAEGANPEEILIKKEDYDDLLKGIKANIKEDEFLVLKYYLQGLTYREIAKNTGFKIKYVDNAIQRIKKKISKINLKNI